MPIVHHLTIVIRAVGVIHHIGVEVVKKDHLAIKLKFMMNTIPDLFDRFS